MAGEEKTEYDVDEERADGGQENTASDSTSRKAA
jgi:hypothetical protein